MKIFLFILKLCLSIVIFHSFFILHVHYQPKLVCLSRLDIILERCIKEVFLCLKDGTWVRTLASHHFGLGLIPGRVVT